MSEQEKYLAEIDAIVSDPNHPYYAPYYDPLHPEWKNAVREVWLLYAKAFGDDKSVNRIMQEINEELDNRGVSHEYED